MISSERRRREKLPETNHSALNTTNNSLRDNLLTLQLTSAILILRTTSYSLKCVEKSRENAKMEFPMGQLLAKITLLPAKEQDVTRQRCCPGFVKNE